MPFVENFVNKSWKVLKLESLHGPREFTHTVNNQYVATVYHLYQITVKIASCPTLFFINKLHLSHDFSYLPRTQWIFKRCSTSKGNDKKNKWAPSSTYIRYSTFFKELNSCSRDFPPQSCSSTCSWLSYRMCSQQRYKAAATATAAYC